MNQTSQRAWSFPDRPLSRYLALAIGIAGLSSAGVFYKMAAAPTIAIVAWRMLFSVVMLGPLLLTSRLAAGAPQGASSPQQASGQRALPLARSDLGLAALAGALFALDVTLWALSLLFTSVSSAALLVSMDPIFVAIAAAVLFKERPSVAMIVGMAIAAGGAAVITVGDFRISGRAIYGDALALAAALAETGYLLLGRYVRQRVDTLRYVTVVYSACAVCVWLALLAFRVPAAVSGHDLLMAAALALFATVVGHTLVSKSLGHMPAAVVAIAFLSQPIMTALLAYLVLGMGVAPLTAIGGTIALAGIGVVVLANERAVAGTPAQAV